VEVVVGDITKADTLPDAIKDVDHVIFTAGVTQRPAGERLTSATEYDGVKNAITTARKTGFNGRFHDVHWSNEILPCRNCLKPHPEKHLEVAQVCGRRDTQRRARLYDCWVNQGGGVLARNAQGLGIDEPLSTFLSGTTGYYEQDGLGSVSSVSNSSGALADTYKFGSFGNLTASTGTLTNAFQYTGREFDAETGLLYYRARYYDQNAGRFIGEDPERFNAGMNFYAYVHNNPINMIDPFGLAQCVYSISMHTMVCQPNADPGQPAIIGPNGEGAIRLGPDDVFSGRGRCKDKPSCAYERREGPIPPGRYKMNYYWETATDTHERFRLEPWPNDSLSRLQRDLGHWRYYGLGAQLHRGHYSEGCINASQDDPATMEQYHQLLHLLMSEEGANFLSVTE
jgi:RHS repeat-associated protein